MKSYRTKFIVGLLLILCFCPLKALAFEKPTPKISQNPFYYLKSDYAMPLLSKDEQNNRASGAKDRFFLPWSGDFRHSKDDLLWPFNAYLPGKVYGENERPREKRWFDEIYSKAHIEAFKDINAPGITIAEGSLRAFPTHDPIFLSPELPGEGYPFDYGQVSRVNPGEPIRISHFSRDNSFAYVETSFAAGWIDSRKIAYVNEGFIDRYMPLPLAVIVKDDKVVSKGNLFIFNVKIGSLFPLNKVLLYDLELLVPTGKDEAGLATLEAVRLPRDFAKRWPIEFSQWNAASLIDEMMGETYGWGGMYGKRDCSATTRDFFLPFGIWLPRNSSAQAKSGTFISLEGLTPLQKEKAIKEGGTPFASILYKPGHVMLYAGSYRGRVVVFHNLWGLRTKSKGVEGRYVIGRSVLSTLDVGKDLPGIDPDGLLINAITGMTNLL